MQLVSTLKRFGRCILKSELQDVETALAVKYVLGQHCETVPNNIVSKLTLNFVWDTNEKNEKTA